MILSVDPGGTVGLALWSEEGECLQNWYLDLDLFIVWCDEFDKPLSTVIYEDFILRRNRANAQTGSKMQASQSIGALKVLAKKHGAKLVRQQPDILGITALHEGIQLPKGHLPDKLSAYLHGRRYFIAQGIVKPLAQQN